MSAAPDPTAEKAAPRSSAVRKVGASVVGISMVAVGVPMLVLPGPGLLMIAGGVGVLATEFPAARRLIDRVRGSTERSDDRSR